MTLLNDLLRPLFDALQMPLASLSTAVGVALWSLPVGIFALWVFGKTSNQERIAAVKRQIHAGLFEIRLFNDDLRAIMRAQGEILRHVLRYQGLALKPMLFILPPLVLVMVQLHQFYGFRGLQPGEQTLLNVRLDPAVANGARPEVALDLPDGVQVVNGPIWAPALGELSWQLGVIAEGDHDLVLKIAGEEVHKSLRATESISRLSPERPPLGFLGQLEWPSEQPLPDSSVVRSITVAYPEGAVSIFGVDFQWSFAWMVFFFILTMVVALALRKPMGIEL
ncbi:MAG: hypothetical protein PVG92_02145 [Holophagae bacterium]|jgi:hypothetical protein